MNKAETREADKARKAAAAGHKEYAAATLASLHRAATAKTQIEIAAIVDELGLSRYVTSSNGCLIARNDHPTAAQVAGMDSMMGALK